MLTTQMYYRQIDEKLEAAESAKNKGKEVLFFPLASLSVSNTAEGGADALAAS